MPSYTGTGPKTSSNMFYVEKNLKIDAPYIINWKEADWQQLNFSL